MTGRRSHGRLSALNGVVHQGSDFLEANELRLGQILDRPLDFISRGRRGLDRLAFAHRWGSISPFPLST